MEITSKNITVDVNRNNTFTEEHIKVTEHLYKNAWKLIESHLFGEDLHPAIRFVGFQIVPVRTSGIDQLHRGASLNPLYKEIQQNIERNGYKLKYAPPAILVSPSLKGGQTTLTGNTREQILADLGFKNMIAAIYEPVAGYSEWKIQEAILECGQTFNSHHDPSSPVGKEDIKRTLRNLIQLHEDSKGESGVPLRLHLLEEEVDRLCGKGVFQPQVRLQIAQEVYTEHKPDEIVVSWQESKSASYVITTYQDKYKFRNIEPTYFKNGKLKTRGIVYFYTSASTPTKAFAKAVKLSQLYPDSDIRTLIHTSTLSGKNYHTTYQNRISKFIEIFEDLKTAAVLLTKGKVEEAKRIGVYAAFPALSEFHDLDKPVFVQVGDEIMLYQKTEDENPYEVCIKISSADSLDDEEDELENAA